ncbi:WD40-repeat-containing domain protein, partial [Pelagophyceae sp. CCMP2097]
MAPVPTLFEPVVLYDLKRHAREFRCVSLSGDGLFCAAVGGDEVVWFDVVDNRILWTTTVASEPDQPADVVSCAVSADGSAIVVGVSDGRVLVLDAVSGAVTTRQTHRACASNSRVAAVACSALCYCSAGVDGAVVVFRFGAGDSVATSYVVLETAHSARRNHEGHDDSVALELANFGEECLSANFRDMVSERHVAPVPAALFCCAISANSIAAGGEGETVSVWETCDGAWEKAEVFDLEGHETTVLALAWAPGNTLASLDAGGQVRLWQSKNCAAVFGFAGRRGCCLGFSKCGNWLAAGAQQGLKVWDVAQEGPPKLVLFAHDDVGLRAASVVWPLPTSKAFTAVAAGVDRKRLIWRAPECCLDGDSAVARLTLHEEVDRFQARFSGGETADASIDLATIDRQDMAARLWRATPDESVPVLRCAAFVSAADCLGARSAAVSFGTAFACRPARHRGAVLAIADDEASVRAFHVQPAAPDDKAASTSGVFSGGFDVEQLASAPSRVPVRSVGFGWGRTVMISDVLGTVNFVDAATGARALAPQIGTLEARFSAARVRRVRVRRRGRMGLCIVVIRGRRRRAENMVLHQLRGGANHSLESKLQRGGHACHAALRHDADPRLRCKRAAHPRRLPPRFGRRRHLAARAKALRRWKCRRRFYAAAARLHRHCSAGRRRRPRRRVLVRHGRVRAAPMRRRLRRLGKSAARLCGGGARRCRPRRLAIFSDGDGVAPHDPPACATGAAQLTGNRLRPQTSHVTELSRKQTPNA